MKLIQAQAFVDELSKEAAMPGLLRNLWSSGLGRAGAGAALGAGAGALANPEDRLRGALLGGTAGAVGGLAAPLATSAGRRGALDAIKLTGKAQWHGITRRGRMPLGGIKDKAERVAMRKAEKAGITSLPGMVKGLAGKNRGKVLGEAWRQSGRMGKVMGAADLAMSAPHIMNQNTEAGTGEKVLSTLGSSGGYLFGSRMPLVGSMLFAGGAGTIGKYLGKGVDKVRGYKPPKKPDSEEAFQIRPAARNLALQTGRNIIDEARPAVGRLVEANE